MRETFARIGENTYYRATDEEELSHGLRECDVTRGGYPPACRYRDCDRCSPIDWKWSPSIHMPRSASRILLEITDVRVQRLQEISEGDARAEGAECMGVVFRDEPSPTQHFELTRYRGGFACLWESINGAGSWDANPWLWCVSFKRVGGA